MSAGRSGASRRAVYAGPGPGAWWRGHRRAAADAVTRLRAAPLSTLATLAVFTLALLLPLLLTVLLGNALRFAETLGSARELSVFLEPSADAARAGALAEAFAARADVAAVAVRTPAEGLEEFKRMSDLAGALDLLEGNPLPFVLLVSPAGAAERDPGALVQALQAEGDVESVQYDAAWRARLDAWLALARRTALLLAALLGLGALLVVGNTVRLDLAARRDEIALMQLLGADAADIRRPMLHFGLLLGVAAGALAVLAAFAIGLALQAPLAALAATYADGVTPAGLGWIGALAVPAVGALLGWLGARLAAGHHLRTSLPAAR